MLNIKIDEKKNNLEIIIPLKTTRSNPYMEDYHPEMDNLIGVIESEMDFGFCYRIDMEYKNKGDQWTDYVLKLDKDMNRKEFRELCKRLDIDLVD